MSLLTVPRAQLLAYVQAVPGNNAGNIAAAYDNLILANAQSQARSQLGFRAYENVAKKRNVALTHPDIYLKAKAIKISGGEIPMVQGQPRDVIDAWTALFPGVANIGGNAPIDVDALVGDQRSIAAQVADVYANTLRSLYNAGADVETSEKYAKQVAQSLADAKLAIVEMDMPDYLGESAEKSLFTAQISGAEPQKMLGARALPSSGGRRMLTHK
jgi:hypothetical protein